MVIFRQTNFTHLPSHKSNICCTLPHTYWTILSLMQEWARFPPGAGQGPPISGTWQRHRHLDDDQVAPASKETVFLHLTSAWPGVNGLAVPLARQKQLKRDKILIPVRSGTVLSNRLPCPPSTLMYPVSLLSGCWDRSWSSQKSKYQFRDHLVGDQLLAPKNLIVSLTTECPALW